MGKGKGSTSRYYYEPKNELRYEAAKIQRMIRLMDKQAEIDVSKVSMKSYLELLKRHGELVKEIKKQKAMRGDKDESVHSKVVDKTVSSGSKKGVRKGESAGVGAGVSTTNPFT